MVLVDWVIIAVYFAVLAGIVFWSSRRQESSDDYFLAGRNVGWFAIGASLFASNVGSETHRRLGWRWSHLGNGYGSLGTPRLGFNHARLGLRTILL